MWAQLSQFLILRSQGTKTLGYKSSLEMGDHGYKAGKATKGLRDWRNDMVCGNIKNGKPGSQGCK